MCHVPQKFLKETAFCNIKISESVYIPRNHHLLSFNPTLLDTRCLLLFVTKGISFDLEFRELFLSIRQRVGTIITVYAYVSYVRDFLELNSLTVCLFKIKNGKL